MTANAVRYARNPDFIFRKIVEEMILVPIVQDVANMDCVYALNEIGTLVWQQLENPRSKQELSDIILQDYAAEPETVQMDLNVFLDNMLEAGAIREVE